MKTLINFRLCFKNLCINFKQNFTEKVFKQSRSVKIINFRLCFKNLCTKQNFTGKVSCRIMKHISIRLCFKTFYFKLVNWAEFSCIRLSFFSQTLFVSHKNALLYISLHFNISTFSFISKTRTIYLFHLFNIYLYHQNCDLMYPEVALAYLVFIL